MASEQHYSLNFDAIEPTIDAFFEDKPDYKYEFVKNVDASHTLRIWKDNNGVVSKKKGGLRIYNKQGLYCLVVEGSLNFKTISTECKEYLIEKLRLPDVDLKCFVLRDVDSDLYNAFVDIVKNEYTVKERENSIPDAIQQLNVCDTHQASVHVTFYKNGTIRMQGAYTALFSNLIICATKELAGEDETAIQELISIGRQKSSRYETDITKLVSNSKPLTDYKLSRYVLASTILADSNNELEDYACYSFGILKAIEGLLALKLKAHLASDTDSVGICFEEHATSHIYHLKSSIKDFDGAPELKKYIESAYNTYKNNRHTTFHVRKLHVEASRVLKYEEALSIIDDGL